MRLEIQKVWTTVWLLTKINKGPKPPLSDREVELLEVLSSGQVDGWIGEAHGRNDATLLYIAPKGSGFLKK